MAKHKHPIENHFVRLTRYHYYCFTILYLCKIPIYWHMVNLIFLSPTIDFYCDKRTNQCPCDNPVWDRSTFTETVQTKYNLLCNDTWLISLGQSMLYVGTLIGALLFGFMGDRYGRRTMFSLSCFCIGIFGCLVTVMPSVTFFILMRCLEGTGVGGAIVTGYVLLVEYCGTEHRDVVTALYHLPLNFGHISLAGISYLLRNCDDYQLALSIPMFICVLVSLLLHESPKWLLDNGKIDKAVIVMQKIAKFNGNPTSCDTIQAEMEAYVATEATQRRSKISFWEIFNHKTLSLNLLCMCFVYLVCGMGFYGISQYVGKMSGNIHQNVTICGLLLIPGTIAATFLLGVFSRRWFLMTTYLASGICMLIVVCIPSDLVITKIVIASIASSTFLMAFIILFLYSVELFPTVVRNFVLGFLSVLSRLGQIIAPPINALDSTIGGAIFGIAAILGAVVCYPLPETKNKDLPSTFEDTEAISHHQTTQVSEE